MAAIVGAFVRNVGLIWHFGMSVGSEHKSVQGSESIQGWGRNCRIMLDTWAGCAGKETKKKAAETDRRNRDKLLHSLATRCLKCWSALLWASGFSLSLLHSSPRLSPYRAHLICHTGLRQLSLNTLETKTKIQMSFPGSTLFPMRGGCLHLETRVISNDMWCQNVEAEKMWCLWKYAFVCVLLWKEPRYFLNVDHQITTGISEKKKKAIGSRAAKRLNVADFKFQVISYKRNFHAADSIPWSLKNECG